MKKMLAKAVALSLVLGGVGFVANDALAASNAELEQKINQERNARMVADIDLGDQITKEKMHALMLIKQKQQLVKMLTRS